MYQKAIDHFRQLLTELKSEIHMERELSSKLGNERSKAHCAGRIAAMSQMQRRIEGEIEILINLEQKTENNES